MIWSKAMSGYQGSNADASQRCESIVTSISQHSFFSAIESCTTKTATPAGTFTVKQLAIPRLGDQRAAFILTGEESADSTMTWYVRDAAVRVRSVAIELGLAEICRRPRNPHISAMQSSSVC